MDSGNGFTNKEILLRLEEKVDKALEQHDKRLRILERIVWTFPISLVTGVGSIFITTLHN
jgi:hypothetical protein